jgi:hypothetical protein
MVLLARCVPVVGELLSLGNDDGMGRKVPRPV